jgi:Flp pilus assembly protein TadD
MSKRKAKHKVLTEEVRQGKPLHAKGWSFHRHVLQLLIALLLIVAIFAVFWQVRNHEFLKYDDQDYVTDNPHVKAGLTLKGIIWAFTTTHAANWHPVTWLSHMLDYDLYGLAPGGHHLTSVLFHVANALLLFIIVHRMTKAPWVSGFVAALFAFHPLHVESVAWVAERKDVLSTFFWMLTLLAYIYYVEGPGVGRYSLVVCFFVLGLLAKPMVVTLPFVLLLIDYWPLKRFRFGPSDDEMSSKGHSLMDFHKQTSSALRLFSEKIPLFVLSAASTILTYLAQQKGGGLKSIETYPLDTRVINALVSYAGYIRKMLWPEGMAVFYPYPETFSIWEIVGSITLLSCISILVVRYARKHPFLLVGWFWYLGTLVPVIGLIQVGDQAMADRYTYIPLIGLFIMVGIGFSCLFEKWRYRKVLLGASIGVALFLLMVITRLQINHWQNNVALFKHALHVTSNNFLAHNNLGVALAEQGKDDEAISHYSEALRIKANYTYAHYNLGNALAKQGKVQEAITHYTEALRIKADYTDAHYNLGIALAEQGKTQEAIAHYIEALRIAPDFAKAHYNLGVILFSQGKIQEAIIHFAEVVRIRPDHAIAHNNLGVALLVQGKVQDAIAHFAKAVQAKPNYAEAHINLGFGYLMIGDKVSALEEYRILKKLNPYLADQLYQRISK